MPLSVFGGVHFGRDYSPENTIPITLRAIVAVSVFHFDVVDKKAGGGLLAPSAGADLTIYDNYWFRFGIEGRVTYRWEWVLEDRVQAQLGLTAVFPLIHDTTSP